MTVLTSLSLAGQPPSPAPPADDLLALLNTPVEVSSRRREGVLLTPSTVTVVPRETLERYGVQTLAQALDLVAGVSVQRTIFSSDVPTVRGVLQEGYGNRVLLLINGISTWNVMTGDLTLPRIDVEDIERIEVLRGPASVLYGTTAYAGAINIILGHTVLSSLRAGGSGAGGKTLGANHFHAQGDLSIFASASLRTAMGAIQEIPGEGGSLVRLEDQRRARTANLDLHLRGQGLLINVFEETAPLLGATFTAPSGGGRDLTNKGVLAAYHAETDLGPHLRTRYSFAFDQSQRLFTGSQDGTRSYLQRGARLTHQAVALWNASDRLGLELGGAHETRQNAHYTLFNPTTGATLLEVMPRALSQVEQSAFAQATLTLGRWHALVGTRYTRNDAFGSNLSSRASGVFQLDEQQSLKVIWGQSFRAPALLEQYMAIPGVAYGRADLAPETSTTLEVAYLRAFDCALIQVLAFTSDFRNKLYRTRRYPDFSSDPADPSVIYQNGRTFRARGLELEARYQRPSGLAIFLNADYTRGDHGDEFPGSRGYNARFVPALNGRLGVSRRWGTWTASAVVRRQDATQGPLGPVPAWNGLDFSLQWVQSHHTLTLRHRLFLANAADQTRWFPEYTRRNAQAVPDGMGRQAGYSLSVVF